MYNLNLLHYKNVCNDVDNVMHVSLSDVNLKATHSLHIYPEGTQSVTASTDHSITHLDIHNCEGKHGTEMDGSLD